MLMRKMNTISRKILYTVSTGGLLNKNLNVTVNISFEVNKFSFTIQRSFGVTIKGRPPFF